MVSAQNEPSLQSEADFKYLNMVESVFENSGGLVSEKLDAFPKFASRKAISRFLVRYEIFKKIQNVHGSIIECGVMFGAGLFSFAHLSSIFEPVNHTRKIIGFDTFTGFPDISDKDQGERSSVAFKKGGYAGSSFENILDSVKLYDTNRALSHIPKVELIKGDICITAKKYVEDNPHLIIALLYLDMDIYEPSKAAIEAFLPRMPKGSIIVFDELNYERCPGETKAASEMIGINNLKLERFIFDPSMSYHVIT
tara:strand:+ start:1941 stop:2699 length:759 start_codon:yes stop_codon:yes gene_type:complete